VQIILCDPKGLGVPHPHINCLCMPPKGMFISKIVMYSRFALEYILVSTRTACILIMRCLPPPRQSLRTGIYVAKKLKFFFLPTLSICHFFTSRVHSAKFILMPKFSSVWYLNEQFCSKKVFRYIILPLVNNYNIIPQSVLVF